MTDEDKHEDDKSKAPRAPKPLKPPRAPRPPKELYDPFDYDDNNDEFEFRTEDEYRELRDEYVEQIEEMRREALERMEEKTQRKLEKLQNKLDKLEEKHAIRMEKAQDLRERAEEKEREAEEFRREAERIREKAKRINIYVSPDVSDEWRDWSDKIGSSVSELVRKSMQFVKDNIGDIEKLEQLGDIIERTMEESGIEDIGDQIEKGLKEAGIDGGIHLKSKGKRGTKGKVVPTTEEDTERMRKRIRGLIKLHKSIPIDKLAQALDKSEDHAENLIYELAAEGVEGELDEGVFKFKEDIDKVLSILFRLI